MSIVYFLRTGSVFTGDVLALDYNIHHDPSTGRFTSGSKCGKIGSTKYSPSPQRNKSRMKLKPKTYAMLTGTLNTLYPDAKEGNLYIIRDANHEYVVQADGYGGFQLLQKMRIK